MSGAASPANAAARRLGVVPPTVKPRLRGVSHQYAFFAAVAAGVALVALAPDAAARVPAAIYAAALCAMLGTSALYHRLDWQPGPERWIRRLDHAMIFVLVAATYTPFAALVMSPGLGAVVLAVSWGGALAGVLLTVVWVDAPRALTAGAYVALGWVSVIALPELGDRAGPGCLVLLAAGGLLYTAGAVVYARRRPDPAPAVFGFHEVFHAFVITAAALHFAAVALYALPAGAP